MIRTRSLVLVVVLPVVAALPACSSDPKPPPKSAGDDGVPANSSAENRLRGEPKPEEKTTTNDPTQPLMTPVGASSAAVGDDDPNAKKKPRTGQATKAECNEALDHGLDLMITSDPRFAGIPPEMMQQLRGQAMKDTMREHAGANPCLGKGITRAEYDCEMAASTTADFQKCEKRKK